jgi:hypothetical protein
MPRFDTALPDIVHVRLTVGSIHVITGARDAASVAVTPADPDRAKDVEAAERASVDLIQGRLVVEATEPRRLGNLVGLGPSRPGAVDLVLELPDDVDVTIAAQIATVRVDGRLGRTEIRTQVGALHLDHTGDLTARTSGGDVTARYVAGQARVQGLGTIDLGTLVGPAEVKNLSGPIHVGAAESPLRLRSHTGDLVVEATASDVHARTATGSITVGAATAGILDLRTPMGGIQVGVVEGTSVLVDASAELGRVEQQLDATDGPAAGDRRAEIHAHTSMGDVVIHRAQ